MHRILIIEDDPEVREMLVSSLQPHGFETVEAENGRAGVQLAQVYMPDLVLSDIKMEGFDGYAALAAIRYQPLTSAIPVVLMTGQPDEQGRRFAMELGADDYLVKPFTIAGLVATIHVQLKKQAAIRQAVLRQKAGKTQVTGEPGALDGKGRETAGPAMGAEISMPSETASPRIAARFVTGSPPGSAESFVTSKSAVSLEAHSGQSLESLVETYLRMLNRFHPNLGNTAMRSVALCRTLGEILELTNIEVQDLCWAAALHDISLVGIDREAIGRWMRNPRKVTEEEDAFIKRHSIESQQMLEDNPVFVAAGIIIRSHHENWDGTGYPDGLQRELIPWPARVLAAAIFYCSQHTLGSPAIRALKLQTDKMFDARAVEASSKAHLPSGVREILLNELKAGQIVAKDIHNSTGMVLVHKGRELSDALIAKVSAINRVTPLDQNVLVFC